MTRFNFANKLASRRDAIQAELSTLLFAAVLIVCSIAVGCSSEKPQPVSLNQQPVTPNPAPLAVSTQPAPAAEPAKPVQKKVVRKRPATVTYADKTYGISFDYPRKYAIETGDAANELVSTSPLPMNFVQPGGTALAAVELPETSFPSTDFFSGFFNVSVNKSLSADQCELFSVPESKPGDASQLSKLTIGDMELYGAEAVAGEGPRQSDSKYFHIYQNGNCYEFALNVTTNAADLEAGMKHVDRDRVFDRLAKILATVKVSEVAASEVAASAPVTSSDKPAEVEKPATTDTVDKPAADPSAAPSQAPPKSASDGPMTPSTPVPAASSAANTPSSTEVSPQ